jgi:hypothetical protein
MKIISMFFLLIMGVRSFSQEAEFIDFKELKLSIRIKNVLILFSRILVMIQLLSIYLIAKGRHM